MRKTLLLFMFLYGVIASAQTSDRFVYGYCAETITDGIGTDGGKTVRDMSVALYIPAETLKSFAGCELTSVRAGLFSFMTYGNSLKVFVTEDLYESPLAETTTTSFNGVGISKTGVWNEISFNSPYIVPENVSKGIYIGYTVNANFRPIGVDGVSTPNANGCWYGDETGWEQISSFGCMSVQAVFSGNVPQCNVTLSRIAHPDYIKPNQNFVLAGVIVNKAAQTIHSFDVVCTAQGKSSVYPVSGLDIAQNDSARFIIKNVVLSDEGTYDVKVEVANINGNEAVDYDLSDNSQSFSVQSSSQFVTRSILAEHNTTAVCPNCPYGHMVLDSLFTPRADSVIWVSNHTGYYTDNLTTSVGTTLFSTFIDPIYTSMAPGLMLDRTSMAVFGAMIQSSTGECYRPIFAVNTCENIINNMLDFELGEASPVTLSMTQSYEADSSRLKVTITSDLLGTLRNFSTTLNLFMLEDNIAFADMSGMTTANNVLRSVYGSAGGVQIDYINNHFEGTFYVPINSVWNPNNLKVVAFISDYGELNPIGYRVYNAISQKMNLKKATPSTYVLSYCSDDITEGNVLKSNVGMQAAAVFTASTMEQWKGARITKLRLGMAEVLTNTKLWIRTSYDGDTLVEQAVVNAQPGWNEVILDTPLILDGSAIAIGFSCDDQTVTPGIGGSSCANAFWAKIGTKWIDFTTYNRGRLSIQAVLESDNIVLNDMDVLNVFAHEPLYSQKDNATWSTVVKNRGGQPVSSFDLSYYINETLVGKEHITRTIEPQATDTIASTSSFPLANYVGNAVPFKVELTNLDGGLNEVSTENNLAKGSFAVFDREYPVTHMIEHFTTQACSNCSSGTTALNAAVSQSGLDIVSIAHHVGYQTDHFTLGLSNAFLSMFGGSSYAPGAMVDRLPLPASYNINGTTSVPVFCLTVGNGIPSYIDYVSGAINDAIAQHTTAYASLDIHADYVEETRALTITVTGEKAKYLDYVMADPRLSVFITEDSIVGYQMGAANINEYIHNHVLRSFVTGESWGITPTWQDDDTFTYTTTTTLDSSWVVKNLHFAACIGNYASSINDRMIMNAVQKDFQTATGIHSAIADDADKVSFWVKDGAIVASGAKEISIYSISGAKEVNSNLLPGVHIVKAVKANGTIVIGKVVTK